MTEDFRIDLVPELESLVGSLFQDDALEAAKRVAAEARNIAPVVTGDYQRGIIAQPTKAGARVLASDYKSPWVEFGIPSRGQAPQFVLRRAAEAAGLRFVKKKRGA